MRIIIVFSSPNSDSKEFNIWQPLIDDTGYILVNDSGDKIYAFNGRTLSEDEVWKTNDLSRIISDIINHDNNDCEYVVMLHDRTIPETLIEQFRGIRFKEYAGTGSTFYGVYVVPFANGNIQTCFNRLWNKLQKNETVTKKLETILLACSGYSEHEDNRDMLAAGFGNGINENFEDTDVCEELLAKSIGQTDGKYINIKSLFCHIKEGSVNKGIINAAVSSLADILKN